MRKILICLFILLLIINSGCGKKTDGAKMTPEEELIKCEGYITNLAKACEIYAGHNDGHYPPTLDAVNPYVKTIPVCPSCKKPYIYASQTDPDFFIIQCGGENVHKETGLAGEGNYPVYNSKEGLIRKGAYLTSLPSTVSLITPSPEEIPEETPTQKEETTVPEKTPAKKITPKATKKPEKINPKAAEHNSKGLALMKEDRYDEALEEFNKAIEIEPDYLDAIKNKGNTYYYKADIEKALECYELTIKKDPSYWNGY
ncbi:MAG: tetratricopeptide repeat protein, partial [Candidatus Eremiobacterota bacterium]